MRAIFQWRVLLCAACLLAPLGAAFYAICKCHSSGRLRLGQIASSHLNDDVWMSTYKQLHPLWLLAFRILAFSLLLFSLAVKISISGFGIYMYYTQWTFTLVTVYFGLGSLLSAFGCFCHPQEVRADAQLGIQNSLLEKEKIEAPDFVSYLFAILFQACAGAVMVTDVVYWCILYPYFTIKGNDLNLMTIIMHSLNAIFLLCDAALNRMKVSWLGISYFILWTTAYVVFQWILHAFGSMRWPYPFLDLASPYAPLWYFFFACLHVVCYGGFKLSRDLLHKYFCQDAEENTSF